MIKYLDLFEIRKDYIFLIKQMKILTLILIFFFITTINGKLATVCTKDELCFDNRQEINSTRLRLPKETLGEVDKYISIVMEGIILHSYFNRNLIFKIEEMLQQASKHTFNRKICIKCLILQFLAKEDGLFKTLHEWLEKQIIISYPTFFQNFHYWLNPSFSPKFLFSPKLRNLSKKDRQKIKQALMAQYEEIPFCYRASITNNDIEIQIAIHESEDDTFSNLKLLWGKDEWYTNLCSITQNKISQLVKTNNYLITYLNNKCQEMLEED